MIHAMKDEEKISHDTLPQAVETVLERLERLERALIEGPKSEEDEPLDVEKAADFLGMSPATIRSKASRGELPQPSRRGKKNYWSKRDLRDWLLSGKPDRTEEERQKAAEKMQRAREAKG